ncbi:MAG: GFA family protein [Desulfobulbaceae bacterium]|nr:GFA family protein [Desulfobulbaceae bacterium]
MNEIKNGKGNCLCGSVQVNVSKVKKNVGACHCSMCRKWGGGPLLAVDCGTDVSFEGNENITVYNSSEWAERGFCSKCGSHLFYRLKETNQYIMSVGLFGDEEQFFLDHQIFIDEKPHFYSFAEETLNMTGAEVFAKYAPKSD